MFGWIELGGVLQVRDPSFVHLLGDPAFVPDVSVTAALVQGGEDALDLRRARPRGGQPGTLAVVGLEVGHRVLRADVRQPGARWLEAANGVERVGWPVRVPRTGWPVRVPWTRRARVRRSVAGGDGSVEPGHERALVPAGDGSLLQVGGALGSAARLHPGRDGVRVAVGGRAGPAGPATVIGLVRAVPELVHDTSITA